MHHIFVVSRLRRGRLTAVAGAAVARLAAAFRRKRVQRLAIAAMAAAALPGHAEEAQTLGVRPLRVATVTAVEREVATEVTLTGDIEAQVLSNLSFRLGGKVAERLAEVGQHVTRDQVLARLDPAEQRANLTSAEASLKSSEALLNQAQLNYTRQQQLLAGGFTTRATFDQAEQDLRTNRASVESARAALGTAQEQLGYTELRAGVDGILTARAAERGQVVQAGQTVFTIAQDGPRDAVFAVYEALLASPPHSKSVTVTLEADPAVTTIGMVREIAPLVDAASGTVKVKVGLPQTPPRMTLGGTVIGTGKFRPQECLILPWSTLFRSGADPAVWVVDPASHQVSLRPILVRRFADDGIVLSGGIAPGDRVVSGGVQLLRPGQVVGIAEEAAR